MKRALLTLGLALILAISYYSFAKAGIHQTVTDRPSSGSGSSLNRDSNPLPPAKGSNQETKVGTKETSHIVVVTDENGKPKIVTYKLHSEDGKIIMASDFGCTNGCEVKPTTITDSKVYNAKDQVAAAQQFSDELIKKVYPATTEAKDSTDKDKNGRQKRKRSTDLTEKQEKALDHDIEFCKKDTDGEDFDSESDRLTCIVTFLQQGKDSNGKKINARLAWLPIKKACRQERASAVRDYDDTLGTDEDSVCDAVETLLTDKSLLRYGKNAGVIRNLALETVATSRIQALDSARFQDVQMFASAQDAYRKGRYADARSITSELADRSSYLSSDMQDTAQMVWKFRNMPGYKGVSYMDFINTDPADRLLMSKFQDLQNYPRDLYRGVTNLDTMIDAGELKNAVINLRNGGTSSALNPQFYRFLDEVVRGGNNDGLSGRSQLSLTAPNFSILAAPSSGTGSLAVSPTSLSRGTR